jgi:predicted RNase H-like HicB family nuclease
LEKDEEVVMEPNAVTLPVITPVPIECTFWPEDDGWKGACVELGVAVPGGNFEEAKKNMEKALQEYISAVLRDRGAKIAA